MMQEPPRRLIVVLAMFVATVPFALDMYLPGLPGMAVEFGVDAGQAAHSVSAMAMRCRSSPVSVIRSPGGCEHTSGHLGGA